MTLAILAAAPVARADDVKVVFDRAVKEHDDGKCESTPIGDRVLCERAAEDFRSVYSATPEALGALRDLAYTERGLGRAASARRDFRELAAKAPSDPRPERRAWASFATREADALEPRVPRLTLQIGATPTGLAIFVDGAAAVAGSQLDLDPGSHKIHAQAPGFQPFDGIVELDESDKKTVQILLEPIAAQATTAPAPASTASTSTVAAGPPKSAETRTTHSHTAPVVVTLAGAGLAVLGLGAGAAALITRNGNCDAKKQCDPDSLDTAHNLADVSTVAVILGTAALATGVVWYLVTPSDTASPSAALVISPRSAMAVVRF